MSFRTRLLCSFRRFSVISAKTKQTKMDEEDFISHLIRTVRDEKIIYEKSYKGYNDKNERQNAWERVANIVGRSTWDCEKRWRLLREKYSRERNALNTDPLESEAASSWPFFEMMNFVSDNLKTRKRKPKIEPSIFEMVDSENERKPGTLSPLPQPVQKKKLSERDEVIGALKNAIHLFTAKVNGSENDDDIFARSIVSLMRPLPPLSKDLLKQKIYNLIFEARKHEIQN